MRLDSVINRSVAIIERARYKCEIALFIGYAVDKWFFLESGMRKPESRFITAELDKIADDFIKCAGGGIIEHPFSDVVGDVFTHFRLKEKGGKSFYPTPSGVSSLISQLVDLEETRGNKKIADLCSGTGSLVMQALERLYASDGKKGISEASVYIEELDPTLLKVSFLQIVLSLASIGCATRYMKFSQIDVLTRREQGLTFELWDQGQHAPAESSFSTGM